MAFSDSTIKELQCEIATAKQMRRGIDARISGLEAILASEPTRLSTSHIPDATHQHKAVSTKKSTKKRAAGTHGARRKRQPLRATVSAVIERTPGLTSGQMAQVLKDRGFSVRGKTNLRNRVYHELYRMVQLGLVRKDEKGAYVPTGAHEARTDAESVSQAV